MGCIIGMVCGEVGCGDISGCDGELIDRIFKKKFVMIY